MMLKKCGYMVDCFSSAEEVLEHLQIDSKAGEIDLIESCHD